MKTYMLGTALVCGLSAVAVFVAADPNAPLAVEAAQEKHPHAGAVLSAAREYKSWPRVSEKVLPAPTMCRPMPWPLTSESDDDGTHGRKLYYLYARDVDAYLSVGKPSIDIPLLAAAPTPNGQVIVKESWHPEEAREHAIPSDDQLLLDGRLVGPGEQAELFLMLKVGDRDTAGTDQGWIYATTTPDGTTVTGIGLIASCMGCHENAAYDRQFGLAYKELFVDHPDEK